MHDGLQASRCIKKVLKESPSCVKTADRSCSSSLERSFARAEAREETKTVSSQGFILITNLFYAFFRIFEKEQVSSRTAIQSSSKTALPIIGPERLGTVAELLPKTGDVPGNRWASGKTRIADKIPWSRRQRKNCQRGTLNFNPCKTCR